MKPNMNNNKVCFKVIKQAITRGFITYTCTNHPDIIVNEPGVCPECGKDLVKKY